MFSGTAFKGNKSAGKLLEDKNTFGVNIHVTIKYRVCNICPNGLLLAI